MIELRDYQLEVKDAIRDSYRSGHRAPIVVLPCRSGKTILFSSITQAYASQGQTCMLLAHRRELISQIAQSLAMFGVPHRVIAPPDVIRQIRIAEFRRFGQSFVDQSAHVIVGSVQTLSARIDVIKDLDVRLLVIDECHHVVQRSLYSRIIELYPRARLLMVTATPQRLDGKGLGNDSGGFADDMIIGPSAHWMIERGNISPYRMYGTATPPDVSGIKRVMGDLKKDDLSTLMSKPTIIKGCVEKYKEHAPGMRAVAYAVDIKRSKEIADEFNSAGIPALHFDGDTPADQRKAAVDAFADGKVLVLCNCGLLGEGIDLAALAGKPVTIDCVIDCAPTMSLTNYIQKNMRCMAPAPGKVAVILDMAGNFHRHGFPDDDHDWLLEGTGCRTPGDDEVKPPAVYECEKCHSYWELMPKDGGDPSRKYGTRNPATGQIVCPCCGHEKTKLIRKGPDEIEADIVELTRQREAEEAAKRDARRAQGSAQTAEQLVLKLGYSRGRAHKIVAAREEKAALRKEVARLYSNMLRSEIDSYSPRELKELIKQASIKTID